MQVYGDPWRTIDPSTWRERMAAPLCGATWIERHAERVARLIEAGQCLQALEDQFFEASGGRDYANPQLKPLKRFLLETAEDVAASWRGKEARAPAPPPALPYGKAFAAREPEGYAFYAFYPETVFDAASSVDIPSELALVIGLRSIGASLAPMAAAGLRASAFATVRPTGPVFAREIEAPDLAKALARERPAHVAIVDEGPGLSGSSFAATASFVRAHAPASRLHLFPSHPYGPGSEASDATRKLFQQERQHLVSFDACVGEQIARWFEDLVGPALGPLQDLSGGAWRAHSGLSEESWPAVDCTQERRKFLLTTERGCFLLKFIGLGRFGEEKAALAHALSDAGLAPQVIGWRHGFLLERWRSDARPLHLVRDRDALLPALARYLAFRRQRFPRTNAYGASVPELRDMARRNASLALGEAAGERMCERLAGIERFAPSLKPMATDNRLHAHEWLVTSNGILKTDGADHHAGHDLIGAQDVLYDIAAATIEFALDPDEAREVCRGVEARSGASVCHALLEPMRLIYLAFEIGRLTLAAQANAGGPEQTRLTARLATLTHRLRRELDGGAAQLFGNYKEARSFGRRM